jgi:putative ABC transport system permease protein
MAGVVAFLLVLLAVVAVISLALILRQRLAFRIAIRNARRGRWRTVLVVLGLLIATTIISGSLVIGDTVSAVNLHFTYEAIGFTDEAVYNQSPGGAYLSFPYSVYTDLSSRLAGDAQIAGIAPEIVTAAAVFDNTSGVPQTGLNLIGADPNQTAALGSFTTDGGATLAGPAPGMVLLDDLAAQDLNASAGDHVTLYGASVGGHVLSDRATVQAIVKDDTRGGFLFSGGVFTPLATAQLLTNGSGLVNFLAVTNAGSLTGGVGVSTAVSATINATLAQIHPNYGLASTPLLAENLASAATAGQSLTQLFLVLGLFSIVAGAMLIVGIFVMLAEERKGEMGMVRAIGLRRRQLVLTYFFEGLLYSAGSAGAGTLLGVGVGFGLTYAFSQFFSGGGVSAQAILASFTVNPSSLLIAYVAGFLLTLGTVLVASIRASRLNIVRAIRSVPEPPPSLRAYTFLAYLGILVAILGALLFAASYRGTSDISEPLVGGALLLGGIALILSRFVRNRIVFSLAGAGILLWAGLAPLHRLILGTSHSGTITSLFVEGILMVFGAILLYVFNSSTVVAAVARLAGRRPRTVAVARIGLSYPGRRAFRTAINLTIFSLVLFTVVAVASFGSSVQANLNNTIQAQSGGYSFVGFSSQPIPNLPALIANNATLRPLYQDVVPVISDGALFNYSGSGGPFPYSLFAAPTNASGPNNFYATNAYNFSAVEGSLSAAAIFQRLATDPTVAIVDGAFNGQVTNFGPTHLTLRPGTVMTVANPATGAQARVTVLGIMDQSFVSGIWVSPGLAATLGFSSITAFFFTVAPGQSAVHAAQATKAALFPYGLQLFNFADILRTSIQNTEAVIGLLEIFVALGLAVGIAAMGIVALRAVSERRGEIGMLRAAGFTRGMILRVFLLEYSYVALLGIGIGTALAILLIYNASESVGGLLAFSIPWANVGLVVLVSYLLTVAAILGPSVKASRLPPAEAIRYSE